VAAISWDTLREYCVAALRAGLAPRSVAKTVRDVKAACFFATGQELEPAESQAELPIPRMRTVSLRRPGRPRKYPDSELTEAADKYMRAQGHSTNLVLRNCRQFERLAGKSSIADITVDLIERYRATAAKAGLCPSSIRKTVKDVRAVCAFHSGQRLPQQQPRIPRPEPGTSPPFMRLSDWAVVYTRKQRLRDHCCSSAANRFERLVRSSAVCDITADDLEAFRVACIAKALSPKTIEGSISIIKTLVKKATGQQLEVGRRLRIPRPVPQPVAMDAVNECWPHCEPWLQQWIAVSLWTCLRLSDSLSFIASLTDTPPDSLAWTASKTGHVHQWPIPDWLPQYLTRRRLPFKSGTAHAALLTRLAIASACREAGIPQWKPRNLRQRGLTSWMTASPAAGEVVHGTGFQNVLKHYIDVHEVLREAAGRVRIPSCITGASASPAGVSTGAGGGIHEALSMMSRMDNGTLEFVIQTLRRLSASV